MRPLVIFGLGPFARLMHHHWTQRGVEVVAFCADRAHLADDRFCGLPAVAWEDLAHSHPAAECDLFLAIGYRRMRLRKRLFDRARAAGCRLPSYVSPNATVDRTVTLGANNILLDGVIVEPFTTLGDNNILWSGTLAAHDGRLGSHNFFAPRVSLAGNVTVGDLCFCGIGSTAIDGLRIADETCLVAGSVLFRDTEPHTRYRGNPATACGTHPDTGIVIDR